MTQIKFLLSSWHYDSKYSFKSIFLFYFLTWLFGIFIFQKLHLEMLSDKPRTLAYQTAIQNNARYLKDKVRLHTLTVGLEFNGPVNTIKVTSSQSVYLTTLFLDILSPLSTYTDEGGRVWRRGPVSYVIGASN